VRQVGPREVAVVLEGGRAVPSGLGLGDPQLHAVQPPGVGARRLLGVGDPVAGGHQVQLPGPDDLLGPEAVPVQHRPVQQPRHGLQPDVGVRADVEAPLAADVARAHHVDEAPGAHRPPRPPGQDAAHAEAADLGAAALDDGDLVRLGRVGRRAGRGVVGGHGPAHPAIPTRSCPGWPGPPAGISP
jgi:hypothetical protein